MPEEPESASEWEKRISRHRAKKDEYFASDPGSPIPADKRDTFDGLGYFPPNPAYRLEGRYEALASPEEVELGSTRGPPIEYSRVGTVGFDFQGDHHVLRVYQSPGVDDVLLPFRDGTNGRETWAHGRYLTLDVDPRESTDPVVVDFNVAYHPFPVYSADYVAAIPPKENELPFDVRAGERL